MTARGRDALLGAVFLLFAAAAVLLTAAHRGQSAHSFSVRTCLENLADCRGEPLIRLRGEYVAGSQMWPHAGCQSELDLQSPGGATPGKIRVCSSQMPTPAFDSASNAVVLLETVGHFDGSRMNARSVSIAAAR